MEENLLGLNLQSLQIYKVYNWPWNEMPWPQRPSTDKFHTYRVPEIIPTLIFILNILSSQPL